jgi:formimidoylglutamate deiminase
LQAGELAVGKRADWLVLAEDAFLGSVSSASLLNRWLFGGQREQIRDVFVAGKQVIHQGHHPAEAAAAARFAEAMRALQ